MATDPVIRVSGIRKVYGPVVAVDDVSFEVRRGFGVAFTALAARVFRWE